MAQDLFPGDNSIFNFTTTIHGESQRKRERESECEGCAFLPNLCVHAPQLQHFLRCPERTALENRGLNNFSLCSFVLVYSLPVIKGGRGQKEGRVSLYQVAVVI